MSVNSEIYDALAVIASIVGVYDTKLPDDLELGTDPAIVFQLISDVPTAPIDDGIIGREQIWQVSVYATDLEAARTTKEAVVTALHGLSADTIQRCVWESAPGEIYDADSIPPQYFIPIDFSVSI